jgi:hypothetical protein
MTAQWFLDDIRRLMSLRKRVVVLDPTGQCTFLIDLLQTSSYTVLATNRQLSEPWRQQKDEMMLRYEAETTFAQDPVVFYVTRPKEKLTFLFDYCFTHGCLDLSMPQNWLRKHILAHTGMSVNFETPYLFIAAKIGLNKDLTWWKRIVQDLEQLINPDDELLPFLHDPEEYMASRDADIRRLIEEKFFELLGQPYLKKPPKTLANELVKCLLNGLVQNNLQSVFSRTYEKWLDSATYRPSLMRYVQNYKLPPDASPWRGDPRHCFEALDLMAIRDLSSHFRDKSYVAQKLTVLKERIRLAGILPTVPHWWIDLQILVDADTEPLVRCTNLNLFVGYYTSHFAFVDRAVRNLYEQFLSEESIMRPIQEYYDGMNALLLDTWFGLRSEYRPNQQGYLKTLFDAAPPKTAVIVGDGVRYEMANFVASQLDSQFVVNRGVMMADMPSETEHNMSALYVGNQEVLAVHKEREGRLTQSTGKNLVYLPLEQLNHGTDADYLVLTYKDIDKAGESLQQAAIKLFSEFERVLVDKITLLLQMGYQNVHLLTDHGFVLTGLLEESDKIDPSASGPKEVHERFVRTRDPQTSDSWLEFAKPYGNFNYVYVARSHRPFKSKGVYGYAHGGFTPQETIIPAFMFSQSTKTEEKLSVQVSNKSDLNEVPSELFVIRLQASGVGGELFNATRKIQIRLYSGQIELQCSDIFTLSAAERQEKEFSFGNHTEVRAVVLDAISQQQLDSVMIRKSNLRDLGGL